MNVLKNLENVQKSSLLKESFNEGATESIRCLLRWKVVTHSNLPV